MLIHAAIVRGSLQAGLYLVASPRQQCLSRRDETSRLIPVDFTHPDLDFIALDSDYGISSLVSNTHPSKSTIVMGMALTQGNRMK